MVAARVEQPEIEQSPLLQFHVFLHRPAGCPDAGTILCEMVGHQNKFDAGRGLPAQGINGC
ncbi:hypothetical protein B5P43_19155 [Bacillus sp. SRB_336]|nr:hypothetical protein B5P43_19155 [Bacillus sp. SRB_336]